MCTIVPPQTLCPPGAALRAPGPPLVPNSSPGPRGPMRREKKPPAAPVSWHIAKRSAKVEHLFQTAKSFFQKPRGQLPAKGSAEAGRKGKDKFNKKTNKEENFFGINNYNASQVLIALNYNRKLFLKRTIKKAIFEFKNGLKKRKK